MKSSPHLDYERIYWGQGYTVLGIDEVGRGCLAGPITVGAVSFSSYLNDERQRALLHYGIQDSKQLSAKKRQVLDALIRQHAVYCHTASSSVQMINEMGIEYSLKQAMATVVKKYISDHPDNKILLLVDGRIIPHIPYINDIERTHIIHGDSISVSIAAASIIAKVARDTYMSQLSGHELYDWENNKGYGTKKHADAIIKCGLSPAHRTLFVRKIISDTAL